MPEKLKFPWMTLPFGVFAVGFALCLREIFVLAGLGGDRAYASGAFLALASALVLFILVPGVRLFMLSLGAALISSVAAASESFGASTTFGFDEIIAAYTALVAVWILLSAMVVRENRVFGAGFLFLVFTNAAVVIATFFVTTWLSRPIRLALGISMFAAGVATATFFRRSAVTVQVREPS